MASGRGGERETENEMERLLPAATVAAANTGERKDLSRGLGGSSLHALNVQGETLALLL